MTFFAVADTTTFGDDIDYLDAGDDMGHGGDNHTTEKENDSNDEDRVQEGREVPNEHEDEEADSHQDEDEHREHSIRRTIMITMMMEIMRRRIWSF